MRSKLLLVISLMRVSATRLTPREQRTYMEVRGVRGMTWGVIDMSATRLTPWEDRTHKRVTKVKDKQHLSDEGSLITWFVQFHT